MELKSTNKDGDKSTEEGNHFTYYQCVADYNLILDIPMRYTKFDVSVATERQLTDKRINET